MAKGQKTFALRADQIKQLVGNLGWCYATNMITVDGQKVGRMYREEPEGDGDSGWRFLSGSESQAYLDDPHHLAIYDVNTIANYDPDIIPLLDEPVGMEYERAEGSGSFEAIAEE